ncbi:ribonuclease T2 family protein [Acinetobacter sp. WZC-1]|uniref:ribonuclease T2 family protein n=1 Tax=Acinetobacter sp. WZC-1 TaxID=3459034 RepID=UPI00403D688E
MKDRISRKLNKAWLIGGVACAAFPVLDVQANTAGARLQGYVMQVQMTPAVCALDSNKRKQRKCLEGYSLIVTGLSPETSQNDCATRSSAALSPLQSRVVAKVMPEENARIQLWHSVGGCVPMNASQYFRTVTNFAEKLKIPADLTGSENKNIQQTALRSQFLKLNPGMSGNSIHFNCSSSRSGPNTILTEVQVCYRVNGRYRQCSAQVVSNCPDSFAIQGAY